MSYFACEMGQTDFHQNVLLWETVIRFSTGKGRSGMVHLWAWAVMVEKIRGDGGCGIV